MGKTLPDSVSEQIKSLCEQGDDYAKLRRYEEAVERYNEALDLIPQPIQIWEAATWILGALGDVCFMKGDYKSGLESLLDAMKCPGGIGNPFLHLRLGQVQFELGNEILAADELARAYMGGGKEIFEGEEPKYFSLVRRTLKEPIEGW